MRQLQSEERDLEVGEVRFRGFDDWRGGVVAWRRVEGGVGDGVGVR
jgi:hypothetical protein